MSSLWQLAVPSMTSKLALWQLLVFSEWYSNGNDKIAMFVNGDYLAEEQLSQVMYDYCVIYKHQWGWFGIILLIGYSFPMQICATAEMNQVLDMTALDFNPWAYQWSVLLEHIDIVVLWCVVSVCGSIQSFVLYCDWYNSHLVRFSSFLIWSIDILHFSLPVICTTNCATISCVFC